MLKARQRLAKPMLDIGRTSWQPPAVTKLGTYKIDLGVCAQVLLPALRMDMERLALPACVAMAEGEALRTTGVPVTFLLAFPVQQALSGLPWCQHKS